MNRGEFIRRISILIGGMFFPKPILNKNGVTKFQNPVSKKTHIESSKTWMWDATYVFEIIYIDNE